MLKSAQKVNDKEINAIQSKQYNQFESWKREHAKFEQMLDNIQVLLTDAQGSTRIQAKETPSIYYEQ